MLPSLVPVGYRADTNTRCICAFNVFGAIIGYAGHSTLTHEMRVQPNTCYNTQTHAVVSPAAGQLIQTLTASSSPPCFTVSPSPGIKQRRWALISSAVGKKPAASGWGGRPARREEGEIWEWDLLETRRKKKKGTCEQATEKGGWKVNGVHIT